MKDIRVAKRYAKALFDNAERDGILDAVVADLLVIQRDFKSVEHLRAVIVQPLVSEQKKFLVIDHAFSDRVTATSLNFIKLLVRKRREALIDEAFREFRTLTDEHYKVVDAVVTTAVPMSETQLNRLRVSLKARTGKSVTLITELNPAIIGGTVVRIGDTVIDGSVRGRLERLEQTLLGSRSLGGVI